MKAEMAIVRIVNTYREDDDCTGTFLEMAKRGSKATRKALLSIAASIGADVSELLPEQREAMSQLVRGLDGDASVFG